MDKNTTIDILETLVKYLEGRTNNLLSVFLADFEKIFKKPAQGGPRTLSENVASSSTFGYVLRGQEDNTCSGIRRCCFVALQQNKDELSHQNGGCLTHLFTLCR